MGILASALFLILVLVLGFRYNNWTLSFMVFAFTGAFAVLLAQSNVEEIKKNWKERRCDLEIMLTAQMFKPEDDPRSGGEFASDNFNFCVRGIFIQMINTALAPVYVLVNQQLDTTESINEVMNQFRVMIAALYQGFLNIIEPIFNRFRTTGSQFGATYHKLLSAIGRAFGITQAILYIGISLVTAIENFIHLVINIIMIILYVILGLMIILWFAILPVFGLIIFTCQMIGNSPFGYLSQDVCGELCFDPSTRIRLQKGILKTIEECQLGDTFEDGTVIEGILHVSGKYEPMYSLDGIRVSGAHLVWYEKMQEWIPVVQHPEAIRIFESCPTLICLRTSTRNIPLQGLQRKWLFRDWEELPANLPYSDTIWDFLVSEFLNEKASKQPTPMSIPLLKETAQVMFKTGEMRRISEIRIGDSIYSSNGFTTVTGVYVGESEFLKEEEVSDGVWIKEMAGKDWMHPSQKEGQTSLNKGFHLTTESGCFWIQTNNFSGFVRDFTEVGTKNLPFTYTYTRKLLKKSFSREESCVSDSLSQVLLSYSQPIF